MADFTIKRNDTKPYLIASLKTNGVAYNLTGASAKFIMKLEGAVTPKVSQPALLNDPVNGVLEYRWSPTDTDTEGIYNAEWEVTDSGGKVITFPNGGDGADYFTIEVVEDLG